MYSEGGWSQYSAVERIPGPSRSATLKYKKRGAQTVSLINLVWKLSDQFQTAVPDFSVPDCSERELGMHNVILHCLSVAYMCVAG